MYHVYDQVHSNEIVAYPYCTLLHSLVYNGTVHLHVECVQVVLAWTTRRDSLKLHHHAHLADRSFQAVWPVNRSTKSHRVPE